MTVGRDIGGSRGALWTPSQTAVENEALRLSRGRIYANRATRSSARQIADALLQVITEQGTGLEEHLERVSDFSCSVAQTLGEREEDVWRVGLAAELHDVGKTAIPSAILNKPGPLDEREWQLMRLHPLVGERIVKAAPALAGAASLIRSSHERIDGDGYPDGLTGASIPLGARIIAVCDSFDAMTSDRSYRDAMTPDDALTELRRCTGTQFDPEVVAAFCATQV